MPEALEMYDWIKFTKKQHLTIFDLEKWKINETKTVAIFDRNFEEYFIWDDLSKYKIYKPRYFFKANKCKVTYRGNMVWSIDNFGDDECGRPVELDTAILNNGYKWMPVINNYVRCSKKPGYSCSFFPNNTRIGWRGPMMLWTDLVNGPDVYYAELD